uniref:Uncharacterized protein n=1 Tax=Rhizophora mucronata TaxID=61149 RepID=A0A2P2QIU0_RHIMU
MHQIPDIPQAAPRVRPLEFKTSFITRTNTRAYISGEGINKSLCSITLRRVPIRISQLSLCRQQLCPME